jgi:hypothetical protein
VRTVHLKHSTSLETATFNVSDSKVENGHFEVVESCVNGNIKRELKKTANEDVNEIAWEWFVSARVKIHRVTGLTVKEYAKK